jgi:hypothetical protein
MKNILFILLIHAGVLHNISAQNSKKGFEFTGTKARYSFLGKSKMFSEGVKTVEYSIYWNKKKNIITVNAGPKEKWYTIQITGIDTIHGNITQIGMLEGIDSQADAETIAKSKCEVRFLIDKISIKIGESKLEEYLLDGALVWDDRKTGQK